MKVVPIIVYVFTVIAMWTYINFEVAKLEITNIGLRSLLGIAQMDINQAERNIRILDERVPRYIKMDAQGKVYCSCIDNKIKE